MERWRFRVAVFAELVFLSAYIVCSFRQDWAQGAAYGVGAILVHLYARDR